MVGFVLGLLLRRCLSRLFRLRPSPLQRSCLLCGRPHPVYDLPETGVHHLIEVLRCQDVYVVTENLCLRKFGKVIQHLLEQLGNVEPFGVNGVGGNRVEFFDGQASGVVLQQVIDERDSPLGFSASLATNQPVPTPAGGKMPEPSMDGKGKNPTSNSWTAWTISDTSHVPVGFMAASPE